MNWSTYHAKNTLRRVLLITALILWTAVMLGALLFLPGCQNYYLAKSWECADGTTVIALQDNCDDEFTLDAGAWTEAQKRGYRVVQVIGERWFPDIFMGRWGDGGTESALRLTRWYRLSNVRHER